MKLEDRSHLPSHGIGYIRQTDQYWMSYISDSP